ncbi:hypothetical protein PPROV_001004300 [Pycnococcus provasolii]|uniref:N-acetyltransferase domain-containing protein n=1 Tax=Pycnococcus provasolii TaxID=41880 RepID=A0A830HXI8_9CHLO|nr:hypothetical protein PPROV_001004300 [Pycnococcus provasolii]
MEACRRARTMRARHADMLKPQRLTMRTTDFGAGSLFRVFRSTARCEGDVVGVVEGFVVPPLGLLHLDSMRIYNSRLREQRGAFGVGLSLGLETALYGYETGCHTAELLAINDDDHTHRRLVRYYRRLGCVPVCEVTGDKPGDVAHMLVWGGAGTRMDFDVRGVLEKWGLWSNDDDDDDDEDIAR